jgi:hypothetical protein
MAANLQVSYSDDVVPEARNFAYNTDVCVHLPEGQRRLIFGGILKENSDEVRELAKIDFNEDDQVPTLTLLEFRGSQNTKIKIAEDTICPVRLQDRRKLIVHFKRGHKNDGVHFKGGFVFCSGEQRSEPFFVTSRGKTQKGKNSNPSSPVAASKAPSTLKEKNVAMSVTNVELLPPWGLEGYATVIHLTVSDGSAFVQQMGEHPYEKAKWKFQFRSGTSDKYNISQVTKVCDVELMKENVVAVTIRVPKQPNPQDNIVAVEPMFADEEFVVCNGSFSYLNNELNIDELLQGLDLE